MFERTPVDKIKRMFLDAKHQPSIRREEPKQPLHWRPELQSRNTLARRALDRCRGIIRAFKWCTKALFRGRVDTTFAHFSVLSTQVHVLQYKELSPGNVKIKLVTVCLFFTVDVVSLFVPRFYKTPPLREFVLSFGSTAVIFSGGFAPTKSSP